jgi:hypothetical protein
LLDVLASPRPLTPAVVIRELEELVTLPARDPDARAPA